jgi:small subunit ribosomal protein S17
MDKTVTVEVVRRYLAPMYKKYVRSRRRYQAHDEKNEYCVGDRVEIQESRPLSKHKRWIVTKLIAASADRER